ncbi:PEP-CTERM sorting domain-containing protein [Rubrivivax sp. A210]|uniref:PEP-CTERM sorting domain-containing protein n=1 Tax=Rubrivivax sp. A210 TaxID=2772301 RepID=UPI00191A58E1|nr:PEP-CTERM sorting domain-containing protein [Rubrivivax sp. A210]
MTKTLLSTAVLALASLPAAAATVSLTNTYALSSLLAAPSSNFAPQGMGYDAAANELLFIQQSTNTIYRTDLSGQIVGSRTLGALPTGSYAAGSAHHTVSVAADANNYYFTDYTCNSSCRDLYSIGKTSGAAVALSAEVAGYGGYPIDVRNGMLYRTTASNTYGFGNLGQIRVSSIAAPDVTLTTLALGGSLGIADFAVDLDHGAIWSLDYPSNNYQPATSTLPATLRRFDLATGVLQESYALGMDSVSGGLTYANNTLYHYDWASGGSTLRTYSISGLASLNSNNVPEPGTPALLLAALAGLAALRASRRRQA